MNRKKIEAHLNNAIEKLTPDLFDVIANTPVRKMEKHDYITRQEINEKPNYQHQLIAISVSLMLLICSITGWYQFFSVDSIINIDVNPSLEITTNKQNKVLNIEAINNDADIIIDDLKYKNVDLGIAINAIIRAMNKMGYLSTDSNVILVSVQHKNLTTAANLQEQIVNDITSALSNTEVKPKILQQIILPDNNLKNQSKEYNISSGKLNFINKLVGLEHSLSIPQLAPLSLQELTQLAKEKHLDLDGLTEYEDNYFEDDNDTNKHIDNANNKEISKPTANYKKNTFNPIPNKNKVDEHILENNNSVAPNITIEKINRIDDYDYTNNKNEPTTSNPTSNVSFPITDDEFEYESDSSHQSNDNEFDDGNYSVELSDDDNDSDDSVVLSDDDDSDDSEDFSDDDDSDDSEDFSDDGDSDDSDELSDDGDSDDSDELSDDGDSDDSEDFSDDDDSDDSEELSD